VILTDDEILRCQFRSLGIAVTRDIKPFNLATMLITHSTQVHMFPFWRIFTDDGFTRSFYYEMQFRPGMVGPRDMLRVDDWARARPWRRLETKALPNLAEAQCRRAFERNLDLKRNLVGYAKGQLLAKWCLEQFGWPMENDFRLLDCSEHTARVVVAADEYWDLRDQKHNVFDSVTPGSGWLKLLHLLAEA
jgi:hypothetical protein